MKKVVVCFFVCASMLQAQWVKLNRPSAPGATHLTIYKSTIFTDASTGGIYRSTDEGNSWYLCTNGLAGFTTIGALVADSSVVYANGANFFRSTDNGNSWFHFSATTMNWLAVNVVSSTRRLFAGHSGWTDSQRIFEWGLYSSDSEGSWWTSSWKAITTVYSIVCRDSVVYVGHRGGAEMSTDNGNTWKSINDSFQNGRLIACLAIKGDYIFAGSDGVVFRTSNNGINWWAGPNGFPNSTVKSLAVSGNDIFCGTNGVGVFRSTDNGTTWSELNIGLTSKYVYSLVASDSNLFAATGDAIFKYKLSDLQTSAPVKQSQSPQSFALHQNYPNPFNPSTTIAYNLAQASPVKLTICNTLGQVVAVVVDRHEQAGRHTINFDASHLPSGLYFMRLDAGAFTQVRKMMALK
jgi:photosystem II stability/assembly factor-like uncharacterized protein